MENIVNIYEQDDEITVTFDIENETVMSMGEELNEINEEAYMNGYNWDALLNAYMEIYAPEICELADTDPEAGMYCAYFPLNEEGKAAAGKLCDIINELINAPKKLYEFVKTHGDDIEWD